MEPAAETVETAANTALGKKLLVGDGIPADPQRGTALIAGAAARGDAHNSAFEFDLLSLDVVLLLTRARIAAAAPDRRTLHAGLAPTSGEKWLLSQWIRGRPLGSS